MEFFETKIKNGDRYVNFCTFMCSKCACDLPESSPMHKCESGMYCPECAFIEGLIDHDELMRLSYWLAIDSYAKIINGEVVFFPGKEPRKKKDRRGSAEYLNWRNSVFERDNYTCQECGAVGGVLNAHHIKPYARYKRLRLSLKNGVTLCEKCHKAKHIGGAH